MPTSSSRPPADLAVQLAAGDVVGHAHRACQRNADLATQQPEYRAAQQCRAQCAHGDHGPQHRTGFAHQDRARHHHAQRETLRRRADLQRHVGFDHRFAGCVLHLAEHGLVRGDLLQQAGCVGIGERLAEQGRVVVGDHHAGGGQQADEAGLHRGELGDAFLQRLQGEVHGHHADVFVTVQDGRGQRRHQHVLAGDLVDVGLGDDRALQLARAQVPIARTGHLVIAQSLQQRRAVAPGPIAHEAAGVVVALGRHMRRVLAVEGVGFPQGAHADPFGVRLQLAPDDGAGGRAADAVAGALGEQRMRQGLVTVEGAPEFARNALRFQAGQPFHRGARAR